MRTQAEDISSKPLVGPTEDLGAVKVGSGRIVALEIEPPSLLVNLV